MLEHQQRQLQVLSLGGGGGAVDELCSSPLALNLNELGEANLLEMLQVLTRRRDELRQMDQQLFDLMAECCVRLKPAGATGAQQAIDLSSAVVAAAAAVEFNLPEASNQQQEMDNSEHSEEANKKERQDEGEGAGKRKGASPRYSPSLHIKKMRLLSGIVSRDDIGEKQQVLAEKELDVREESEDDEQQHQGQAAAAAAAAAASFSTTTTTSTTGAQESKREICNNSTSSSSATSSSSLSSSSASSSCSMTSSPPAQAYQQLATSNHHRHQQQQAPPPPPPPPASASIQLESNSTTTTRSDDDDDDEFGGRQDLQLQVRANCGPFSLHSDPTTQLDHKIGQQQQQQQEERPQLKKFYSIGTAEMSFERSLRQQHLIDSTLAHLVQQQQQQSASGMLVPVHQQHQRETLNCFAANSGGIACLSPTGSYATGKHQQVSMLSPLMLPAMSQQAAAMHYCGANGLQLKAAGAPLPLSSLPGTPLTPSGDPNHHHQQQFVYMHQQQQQHQQVKISPFDRMLVNAKDLGPLVRKMSFRCHVCSSCFEDRHRLQQHLSIHLNLHASWFEEKTIKETMAQYELRRGDYLCQVCQLRYETTAEFDKHMHLHGEKPHQCELCQQDNKFVSFRYFRQLLTHLRSHCFLYSCRFVPECRQTANRKDYLKLHILKHHLNNKLPEQFTICCH